MITREGDSSMRAARQTKKTNNQKQRVVSKGTFFTTLAIVGIVAFCAGTRSNDIVGTVGPVFGLKVPHGSIDLSSVEDTYRQLNSHFDGKLDSGALIAGANKGLVSAAGDKFTQYFDTKEAEAFSDGLSGDVGSGIGVELSIHAGVPTIVQVLPDNPAAKSGLKADDQIIGVNGTSTEGMTAAKVASIVRGDSGSTVKLTIARDGAQHEYSLVRQTINNPSVTGEITDGIGVMKLRRFDEKTGTLARSIATGFKDKQVRGVVVDLRDNGGGYVDAAQAVASLWLDQKTVMIEKQHGTTTNTITSDSNPVLNGVPTIVLVNQNTASASEIVAGALQDYGVAHLIGTTTYGKGTMQQIVELGGGNELKVTIAHWFTPKQRTINGDGLKPNKKVEISEKQLNAGQDPQMKAALEALR